MFNGQAGCFCCADPPDPPPPCEVCEACIGEQAGDCANKVCPSFVIEVEGFANTTTLENCPGYTATGTACGAYNGTFILEKVSDCLYRSDSFVATVPIHTLLNGRQCYECENVEVFYQIRFYTELSGSTTVSRMELTIHRVADAPAYFARAHIAAEFCPPAPPGIGSLFQDGLTLLWPSSMCNDEALQQYEDSEFNPARFVTYLARSYSFQSGLFSRGRTLYGESQTATAFAFLGHTDLDAAPSQYRRAGYEPLALDECGGVKTEFIEPDQGETFESAQQVVLSPHWVCCKDESFDCDLVRDELAKGLRDLQAIPLLRIVDIRCGT